MFADDVLSVLFPHLVRLRIEALWPTGRTVHLRARSRNPSALCPHCGTNSARVHSRYERSLADTAVASRQMVIHLRVRRFFCDRSDCPKKTFAEQIPELTVRYGRCTQLLRTIREYIALALGGRAGARLAERQAVGLGKDALLRLVRALPDPPIGFVRVLGVDDFAFRKGHHYGTIMINMETRQPIDLLPERSADSLAAWLTAHPGIEVICRDRAGCYAEGAARGAGTALQVADRFHLWKNLIEAVERLVGRLRTQWLPPEREPEALIITPEVEGQRIRNTRERHAAVHAMKNKGVRHSDIVTALHMDDKTVRRYLQAATAEELISANPTGRNRLLDDHTTYLHTRIAEGCISADLLHRELIDRGVRVSERTVRRFVQRVKSSNPPREHPKIPKVREVASLIVTHPDHREEQDRVLLKELRARAPDLDAACHLVAHFAGMLTSLTGQQHLEQWVGDAEASELPELRGFAAGLRKDWDAVMAGLSTQWNSGPVEGHVNRVKMIKRQMFGRAKLDLLRKRVLLDR
ncbi:ISL3 family transposase [Streptomyces mirabilis]|uniref:ISL3 family transposase n=1 Tax=Streptomyces mirabilis TaxID=68239 RepID=UPI00382992B7